jgi:hypothetical protein
LKAGVQVDIVKQAVVLSESAKVKGGAEVQEKNHWRKEEKRLGREASFPGVWEEKLLLVFDSKIEIIGPANLPQPAMTLRFFSLP